MLIANKLPYKQILLRSWKVLFLLIIYSTILVHLHDTLDQNYLEVHPAIPGILGTALAFFLGFITNSAYDRWWEARKQWGQIVNDSRTLTRQVLSFNKGLPENSKKVIYLIIAWCWSFALTLKKGELDLNHHKYLCKEDKKWLNNQANIPSGILCLIHKEIKNMEISGAISPFELIQMDATVGRMCDSMGACERIKNTVFPTQYGFFVHFLLLLFLFILPLGIVEQLHLATVPVTAVIGGIFLMIESIEQNMQTPFGGLKSDTAVYSISRTIEINLLDLLGEERPDTWKTVNGVLT